MRSGLSPRLRELVDALPVRPDVRVLEIGCGPGAPEDLVLRPSDEAFDLVYAFRVPCASWRSSVADSAPASPDS